MRNTAFLEIRAVVGNRRRSLTRHQHRRGVAARHITLERIQGVVTRLPLELLLQVGSQMDAGVEVLPDEGVVLHIFNVVLLGHIASCEVSDTIHGHDTNVLNGTQQVLDRGFEKARPTLRIPEDFIPGV